MNHHLDPDLVIAEQLNFCDLLIIFFFLLVFIAIPRMMNRNSQENASDQEYLLMGRGLTLPLFVATLTATWYGGILGVTQIAYLNGVYSFFTQGLFWYFSYFAFAILLAKKIRQHKVLSLPELIGRKFGEKARRLSAVILFFHALPVTYGISVGVLLKLALGIDYFWALIIGVVIVAIYTSMGGFRSVVATDAVQFVLMFVAVIMVVVVAMTQFGGISFLTSSLPSHYFAWRGENQISTALIWFFIACTSTFIHPVFYQRCLAAKTDNIAIGGIFVAMGFWLIFDVCTTLGGLYARALLPGADSATAYLILGLNLLPHGLRGVFISGVLATILSTLDSFMFVSGTSISYDLLQRRTIFKGYEHQIAIFMCAFLVIVLGFIFESNFESAWLFMEGAFSTSMMVPVIAAIFLKRQLCNHNFLLPALGAIFAFCVATYFKNISLIEPFYLAHGVAFILFALALKLKANRQTEMANFADG